MYTKPALADSHVLLPVLPAAGPPPADRVVAAAPALPERASRSRPQHLLDLACKVAQAAWGGIGLFASDGELIDHITTGVGEETTISLGRSPAMLGFFGRALL